MRTWASLKSADDPRFADAKALMKHWQEAGELIAEAIAKQPFEYWRQHLKTMKGQWAPVQSLLDLATDEQALANDMLFEVEASDGGAPIKLVRGPVQFNHEPVENDPRSAGLGTYRNRADGTRAGVGAHRATESRGCNCLMITGDL